MGPNQVVALFNANIGVLYSLVMFFSKVWAVTVIGKATTNELALRVTVGVDLLLAIIYGFCGAEPYLPAYLHKKSRVHRWWLLISCAVVQSLNTFILAAPAVYLTTPPFSPLFTYAKYIVVHEVTWLALLSLASPFRPDKVKALFCDKDNQPPPEPEINFDQGIVKSVVWLYILMLFAGLSRLFLFIPQIVVLLGARFPVDKAFIWVAADFAITLCLCLLVFLFSMRRYHKGVWTTGLLLDYWRFYKWWLTTCCLWTVLASPLFLRMPSTPISSTYKVLQATVSINCTVYGLIVLVFILPPLSVRYQFGLYMRTFWWAIRGKVVPEMKLDTQGENARHNESIRYVGVFFLIYHMIVLIPEVLILFGAKDYDCEPALQALVGVHIALFLGWLYLCCVVAVHSITRWWKLSIVFVVFLVFLEVSVRFLGIAFMGWRNSSDFEVGCPAHVYKIVLADVILFFISFLLVVLLLKTVGKVFPIKLDTVWWEERVDLAAEVDLTDLANGDFPGGTTPGTGGDKAGELPDEAAIEPPNPISDPSSPTVLPMQYGYERRSSEPMAEEDASSLDEGFPQGTAPELHTRSPPPQEVPSDHHYVEHSQSSLNFRATNVPGAMASPTRSPGRKPSLSANRPSSISSSDSNSSIHSTPKHSAGPPNPMQYFQQQQHSMDRASTPEAFPDPVDPTSVPPSTASGSMNHGTGTHKQRAAQSDRNLNDTLMQVESLRSTPDNLQASPPSPQQQHSGVPRSMSLPQAIEDAYVSNVEQLPSNVGGVDVTPALFARPNGL